MEEKKRHTGKDFEIHPIGHHSRLADGAILLEFALAVSAAGREAVGAPAVGVRGALVAVVERLDEVGLCILTGPPDAARARHASRSTNSWVRALVHPRQEDEAAGRVGAVSVVVVVDFAEAVRLPSAREWVDNVNKRADKPWWD